MALSRQETSGKNSDMTSCVTRAFLFTGAIALLSGCAAVPASKENCRKLIAADKECYRQGQGFAASLQSDAAMEQCAAFASQMADAQVSGLSREESKKAEMRHLASTWCVFTCMDGLKGRQYEPPSCEARIEKWNKGITADDYL